MRLPGQGTQPSLQITAARPRENGAPWGWGAVRERRQIIRHVQVGGHVILNSSEPSRGTHGYRNISSL